MRVVQYHPHRAFAEHDRNLLRCFMFADSLLRDIAL